jgi:uncharacterized surface protein with fasciclin (FAS1) repeats
MIATLNGKEVEVRIKNDTVYINDAMVTVADLEADNGVVHVIDAVLIPPRITVVDIIVESDVHETLEAAVIAAGLADDLSGEGPFTVFAPTDDAFAALPDGTVEALLKDPEGDLKDILLYHVVKGKALSGDLSDGQMIATLNGKEVEVRIKNDTVYINNAMVTVADLEADNGVVHVIDAVLIPPAVSKIDSYNTFSNSIQVYPNPTSERVYMDLDFRSSRIIVQLINMSGNMIKSSTFENIDHETRIIDLNDLSSGIYFIRIIDNNKSHTSKIQILY